MPPVDVESPRNPRVKALLRLREPRARRERGVMLVEGTREASRALAAGWRVHEAYLCPPLLRAAGRALAERLEDAGPTPVTMSEPAFRRVSLREGPDGVLLVAAAPQRDLDDLTLPAAALVLVLDGVEKPGNVGAALRSADAAGADAVLVTGGGTDLGNPNVVRASMGSLFGLDVVEADPQRARDFLARQGIAIVAAAPSASTPHWDTDLTGRVALVLGPEDAGLSRAWLDAAGGRVRVPMRGSADSLNVATTAALLLFEAARQRSRTAGSS